MPFSDPQSALFFASCPTPRNRLPHVEMPSLEPPHVDIDARRSSIPATPKTPTPRRSHDRTRRRRSKNVRDELPLQGSNLDSSAPEADVLPVTPRGIAMRPTITLICSVDATRIK